MLKEADMDMELQLTCLDDKFDHITTEQPPTPKRTQSHYQISYKLIRLPSNIVCRVT